MPRAGSLKFSAMCPSLVLKLTWKVKQGTSPQGVAQEGLYCIVAAEIVFEGLFQAH
jgi:hypothetical protein